jgi:hypothetical protein
MVIVVIETPIAKRNSSSLQTDEKQLQQSLQKKVARP